MIASFLLIFLLSPIFLVRWSRWLAVVQQKEYRIDRISAFIKSREGLRDFLRIWPRSSDFTRTGLKRPVKTARALLVGAISAGVTGLVILLATILFQSTLAILSAFLFTYIFVPIILFISCLPTAVAAEILTLKTLKQAQQKLQKGKPMVIGVGGSYGKTSTKHLLHHVLSQKFSVFVTPKSHNTKYSIAKSICLNYTDQKIALLEYGAYKIGEIEYLTNWFPVQLAIETGFTLQHLGIFGSEENSLHAESELIAALPQNGKVFCNSEDPGAAKICEYGREKNQAEVVSYSGPNSAVIFSKLWLNEMGELEFMWNDKEVHTHLIGKHYRVNIQGVIAVAKELGMSDEEVISALESFVPNSSFVRSQKLVSGALLIDDGGTSNPKGFAAAIELAEAIKKTNKILFTSGIVDLGDKSAAVHKELATAAKKVFSQVVHLGVDGQAEFAEVFAENLITQETDIVPVLAQIDKNTLILIEGKIPKSLETAIVQS
jgi:UDP-N-acetylmuramoyl-tripeptide--D-alanyl-D-alanine ligase